MTGPPGSLNQPLAEQLDNLVGIFLHLITPTQLHVILHPHPGTFQYRDSNADEVQPAHCMLESCKQTNKPVNVHQGSKLALPARQMRVRSWLGG